METTYSQTKESTYSATTSNSQISEEGKTSKKALITFICGAAIVFGVAITYCVNTAHYGVGGFLSGAFVLICIFAASTYKSFK